MAKLGFAQNVQQSSTEAMNLEKNIGKFFQKVVQDNSELAASQTRQWNSNRQLATELQNSLESMRSTEVHALLNAFGSIHNQLVSQKYVLYQSDSIN